LCSGYSATTALVVAGLAVIAGVMGLRRGPGVLRLVATAGFCTALVLVPLAGRLWAARASPLARLAASHASVTLDLTTTGDPRPLATTGVAGAPRVAVPTDAAGGSVLVLAPAGQWRDVLPQQRVQVSGTLAPSLDGPLAGATLFADQPPRLTGRPPWWQRAAGAVRAGLRRASDVLPPEERGLLPGLVDGDTAGLDPVLTERFRVAGLTHLVAVSGTNCSIMVGALLLVLRRARARPGWCAIAGAVMVVAFVIVARPSPSVLRAAVMAMIALVCLATGRPRSGVPILAATTLALLGYDPLLAVDAGFAMSVLATASLLLLAPGWAIALRRRRVPAGLAEALAVATAAHLVTAPVIAALSGRISLVAVPANVLAEPAVPLATVLGFGAAVVAPEWSGGAQGLAWLAGWPCRWLVGVADRLGALPGARLPWFGGLLGALTLLAATVALVVLAARRGLGRWLAAAVVVAVLVQVPVRSAVTAWPPPGWDLIACDVGQGDALVLNAGPHTAVEIDAGPDPVLIDRCLRELGIDYVALLAFTHYHLDHVGGLAGVLHGRRVGRVITGPLADPATGVDLVAGLLGAHRLAVAAPPVGARFAIGRVQVQVLGPAAAFHDTRSDPNNSSLVLRASVGDVSILLPGDAEIEAQQAMLAAGVDLRADVLKVPHHGSAYSDPAFLAAVRARVAVISVGRHNDYGHPSPMLLGYLGRLGAPVRRTDQDGDVAVVGDRANLTTVVHGIDTVTAASLPAGALSGRPSSAGPGRMVAWPSDGEAVLVAVRRERPGRRVSCPPTTCRSPCRRWSRSWVMRSCWSPGRSPRCRPPPAGTTRRSPRPSGPDPRSRVRSCTNCSGRRCSATAGWS
jgi:competence protein ComEC